MDSESVSLETILNLEDGMGGTEEEEEERISMWNDMWAGRVGQWDLGGGVRSEVHKMTI